MHGHLPFGTANASVVAAETCQRNFLIPSPGNFLPPDGWFMRIAHSLWPDKPAAWLRSFTGFPERTCRSAASGDTDPSSAMLYVLLRSDAGSDILARIMDGCAAQWWLDLQPARELSAQFKIIPR
jgi:hypothetical protein